MKEPRGVLPVTLVLLSLLSCDSLLLLPVLLSPSPQLRLCGRWWTFVPSSSSSQSIPAAAAIAATRRGGSRMDMAGFGDASSNDTNNNNDNKEVKLKPKQQWDRYTSLKQESSVVVGVKVVVTTTDDDDDDQNGWLVVGAVKCASTISVDVAVARQRALLVEHAKRLYPLQISPKAQIEWGYVPVNLANVDAEEKNNDNDANVPENWVTVDKAVLDSVALKGIEKQMGFVGTPDPTTGFYCVYNEGRLVKSTDGNAAATRPASKKLG